MAETLIDFLKSLGIHTIKDFHTRFCSDKPGTVGIGVESKRNTPLKEYKVRVTVGNVDYADYLIQAESPEEAFKIVKDGLWNMTVKISIEVQGDLQIVKEVIKG